jgi:riboflavin kinase/FMN adenylyltransferase
MQVIKGLKHLPSFPKDCVVAIGNFDGVHLGHRKILQILIREARKHNLFSLLLTFSPHPEKILVGRKPKMLQTIDQRLKEIEKYGIQIAVVLPFNRRFADLSAEEFVRTIVLEKLKAKKIIVGENFRFGKNREGDVSKLIAFAAKFHFEIQSIPQVVKKDDVVSSSLIRELVQKGDIERTNTLTGRPYAIEGTVIKGKSRGKNLGFPTANIHSLNDLAPPGVFISEVEISSKSWPSVTHVGSKPTFNEKDTHIESYIIGFRNNLYGQRIRISFLRKIRDEKKFRTPEDLSLQIRKDLASAKSYFQKKSR